jgi:hypothetical protein
MKLHISSQNVAWVIILGLFGFLTYHYDLWGVFFGDKPGGSLSIIGIFLAGIWILFAGFVGLVSVMLLYGMMSGELKLWEPFDVTLKIPKPRLRSRVTPRDEVLIRIGEASAKRDDAVAEQYLRILEQMDKQK